MKYKYQEFKSKTKLILIICQLWKLLAKIVVGGKSCFFCPLQLLLYRQSAADGTSPFLAPWW